MGVKVDLGGTGKGGEWVTVNLDPGHAHPAPDHVASISASAGQLDSLFEAGTIDELRCLHTLEHLPPFELAANLEYWHRLLKPEGTLYIVVPDVAAIAQRWVAGEISDDAAVGMMYVPPEWQAMGEGERHRWGFTFATLKTALEWAGFTVKQVPVGVSHYVDGYPVPNLGVLAKKGSLYAKD